MNEVNKYIYKLAMIYLASVAIFKKDDDVCGGLIELMFDRKHGPTLNGKFNIYSYDCDNPAVDEPCKRLDGRYFTYYYDGFIAFVEY